MPRGVPCQSYQLEGSNVAKKQQKQKLEIVSPDHERHGQAFLETIGVTAAICGVFLFVLTNEVLIKDRVVE